MKKGIKGAVIKKMMAVNKSNGKTKIKMLTGIKIDRNTWGINLLK